MVERCCSTRSTIRSSTAGQMLARGSAPAALPPRTGPADSPIADRSSTGTTTSTSMVFVLGGCTTTTSRLPPRKRATSSIGRTVADRPMRCAGSLQQLVQPLEGQREVGAALGARHGVHLVDDHRLDAAQGLARRAGEHEEQRLRRRDEHVRRHLVERPPLVLRGVAGADADLEVGHRQVQALRGLPDAGERAAQVALDVDGQRLERADVQHPAAVARLLRRRRRRQPVERPQERRQRLARAGRRDDEGVAPAADRVPGALLRGRRRGEGAREPRPRRGGEAVQGGHAVDPAPGVRQPPAEHRRRTGTMGA